MENSRCNIWVYCPQPEGCNGVDTHRDCWLKHVDDLDPREPVATRHSGVLSTFERCMQQRIAYMLSCWSVVWSMTLRHKTSSANLMRMQ